MASRSFPPLLGSGDCSTESECESLHARVKELDLELAISDRLRLPDQLIQTLLGRGAVPLVVHVESVCVAWRLAIDEDAKAHGSAGRRGSHHEMNVTGVEAVRDAPVRLVQQGSIFLHGSNRPRGPIDGTADPSVMCNVRKLDV
jgi:hypothetical protein